LANLGNDSRGTRRDVAGSITPSASVRHKQRVAAKKANINGVDNAKTVEWGRKVVEYRAEGTVTAIQKAIEK
jgi:Asp-tRNA(Asn)/Glu-tRNA(Gln) amidotransferase B subunit